MYLYRTICSTNYNYGCGLYSTQNDCLLCKVSHGDYSNLPLLFCHFPSSLDPENSKVSESCAVAVTSII